MQSKSGKSAFRKSAQMIWVPSEIEKPRYELLSRKAIVPSEKELLENPRSKSAKLRGIKKINYGKD